MEKTVFPPGHPTCETCDKFDTIPSGVNICRAKPPVIIGGVVSATDQATGQPTHGIVNNTFWPVVSVRVDWCALHSDHDSWIQGQRTRQ